MTEKIKNSYARKLMQEAKDTYFRKRVRTCVFQVLRDAPNVTFEHILKRMFNCDPFFLLQVLQELQEAGFICSAEGQKSLVRYRLKSIDDYPIPEVPPLRQFATESSLGISLSSTQSDKLRNLLQEMFDFLPEPTPVYSQWWFSPATYENLIQWILRICKPHIPVAFLGSGTLGALFSHFSSSHVSIFDVDEVFLEQIDHHCSKRTQVVHYNVSNEPDKSFKQAFKFVFVDPPWSSSLLRTFLARSSTLVSIGHTLAISFPQVLTRPSAECERKELLKLAKTLGLSLKSILPAFTEYSVPSFEQNAYKYHGIRLRQPWRRGDLFIFKKTDDTSVDIRPLIEQTPRWNQYQYGKRRLFLKRDNRFEDGPPSIEHIPGFEDLTYKSTTSRMAAWKSASLISTRNRIAHAYGRKKLSALLRRAFKGNNRVNESNSRFSSTISLEIKKIILDMLENENSQNSGLVAKHEV